MNRHFILLAGITLTLLQLSCTDKSKTGAASSDDDIEKILSGLTLEEKVGQMTNLTLAAIAYEEDSTIKLDTAKLNDVILKHHIGSVQNVINHAYSLDEWHSIIEPIQKLTLEKTRHKVPFLYCIDAVHGANFIKGATLFPHNLGLAATRNPALAESCGSITAAQVRAAGIRYNFSPVLDVGRNQQWSRFGETFGEDIYLVTQMGTASIRGYEGGDVSGYAHVAACMKHFIGYSVPQNGKDRAPAYIPEIVLREYFLPSFRAAVNEGTHTLMVNSAEINGTPVHTSKYLLTDVLRTELGYTGVVITDWMDIIKLHERHQVADSHKEAVYLSVNAGIDMCIVPFDFSFYDDLLALVKEGRITEERINESVRRILKLKKDLGLFTHPYLEKESVAIFSKPEYTQTALQAARESITLLKNDNHTLPLSPRQSVLLTGPFAESISALHGAWSYSWQGNKEYLYPDSLNTLAEIFAAHKSSAVFDVKEWLKTNAFDPAALLKAATSADVFVVCAGEEAYAETPGNIPDLAFDEKQTELIKTLSKSGKPVVLVLLEGRPRIIREIEPYCSAILLAYWPGSQGAQAIYDVLYGNYNPSGKLPFTYPRYSGTLMTYDHKLLDEAVEVVSPEYKYFYEFTPQYPFGHGLSYTTFSYGDITLSTDTLSANDSLTVTVNVTNTGVVAGEEVVELYTRDLFASVTPSVKRLRRFSKINLQPGESKKVIFTITKDDLAFVNEALKTVTEQGDFDIMIAGKKTRVYYKQ